MPFIHTVPKMNVKAVKCVDAALAGVALEARKRRTVLPMIQRPLSEK